MANVYKAYKNKVEAIQLLDNHESIKAVIEFCWYIGMETSAPAMEETIDMIHHAGRIDVGHGRQQFAYFNDYIVRLADDIFIAVTEHEFDMLYEAGVLPAASNTIQFNGNNMDVINAFTNNMFVVSSTINEKCKSGLQFSTMLSTDKKVRLLPGDYVMKIEGDIKVIPMEQFELVHLSDLV
jgi:hypothetical protein